MSEKKGEIRKLKYLWLVGFLREIYFLTLFPKDQSAASNLKGQLRVRVNKMPIPVEKKMFLRVRVNIML